MRKKYRLIPLILVALFFIVGCSSSKSSTHKKEVNLAMIAELTSGDLTTVVDTNTFTMLKNVQEGLYRFDENNRLQKALVKEDPEVSEDKMTYTFHLREDAKWSNGDSVTARDFEYGWKRMCDPKIGASGAYFFDNVIKNAHQVLYEHAPMETLGVKALDDYTLEVRLDRPIPYFLDLLAHALYLPHNQKTIEKFGDKFGSSSETMVYNGPFVLKDWTGSTLKWSYEKNPDYWDKDNVHVDKINIQVIKEDATGAHLFEAGKLDWVQLRGEYAKQYAQNPYFVSVPQNTSVYLTMNQTKKSLLRNKNLRLAISHAYDRQPLTDQVLGDGSIPLGTVTPTNLVKLENGKDYTEEVSDQQKKDVALARTYLERAKEELRQDQFELEYLAVDDESSKLTAEYLQGQIQESLPGVKVIIKTVPAKSLYPTLGKLDYDMARTSWGPDFFDPSTFLDLFTSDSKYNFGKYKNTNYDYYVHQAKFEHAKDNNLRLEDMKKAESLFLQEAGVSTMYARALATLHHPRLKKLFIDPLTGQQTYKFIEISD